MKYRLLLVHCFWVLFALTGGCTLLKEVAEKAPELEKVAADANEIGAAVVAVNPEIGIWIVTGGGLIAAVAKLLTLIKG